MFNLVKKGKNILYFFLQPTFLTYLITALVISLDVLSQQVNMGQFIDSDTIYLPFLFEDVILHGHSFFSWHLTPAPYFFPDMLMFFIIYAVLKNVLFAMIIYAILQCFIILYLSSKIAFMITKKQNAILLIQILFLLMLIFLAVPMVVPYKSILIPTFHVGSIINGLVLIFCMLSYFMSSQKKYLIILFSFSALGAASDLLFIVWFVFPVLASLFLVSRSNHRSLYSYIQIAALIVVGCLFGVLAKYALTIDVSKSFIFNRPDFSLEKIKEFIIIYMKFFYDHSIAYSLIPIFYGCLMVKLIAMIFSKKKVDDDKQNEKMFFLVYFVLLSGLFSIANILVIKNPYGIAMDMPYFRYISTFLFFPVLFCWLPFYSFIDNSILNRGLKFLFYFLAFCAILNLKSPMIDYKSEYTPEDVLCIDKYIHQYNASHTEKIRYGISGYWQAKLTTLFSKENLVVVSYWPNLERQLILTNPEIYRDKYDFAIVAYRSPQLRLDETLLQKINGKPYSKSYCGLKLAVIIYGKDKLKIKA